MATQPPSKLIKKSALPGLASRLVATGVLEEEVAKYAVTQATQKRIPFVTHLIEQRIMSAGEIARHASKDFGYPLLDLSALDVESIPRDTVNDKLIHKHRMVPVLKRRDQLYVAISDPTNIQAVNEIKFHTGLNTHVVLVEDDKLSKFIEEVLTDREDDALGDLSDSGLDDLDITTEEEVHDDDASGETDDAPIVRFVNKILLDGIKKGASDLHFEPYEKSYRVRFRIDGILHEVSNPPINLSSRITARLKVMSKLDISERRIPQDGHFKMKLSKKRSIDFRISTCPVSYGEKVVMRILDPASAQLGIDQLGYEPFQKELFLKAIHRPQGMVLVTGPTGSGKTVSLYTAINILNTHERNISTAEDPVELPLEGVNQVNVNPKAGLTFAFALRSFLRQDPDIVMVGEIRDLETAEIAIKAAQTGHLVLSTLHTNSAAETLTRLVNMGVERFNIATSVTLIIAQRLARRLCSNCKKPITIPATTLLELGYTEDQIEKLELYEPKGCDICSGGYKGRLGLYEVLHMNDKLGRIIMDGGNSLDILEKASEQGFKTLRQSGLKKAGLGLTTLEEVNRVTKD